MKFQDPFQINVTIDLSVASESNPVNECDHVIYIESPGRIPLSQEDRDVIKERTGTDQQYTDRTVDGYCPGGDYRALNISNRVIPRSVERDENGKMINGLTESGEATFERTLSHELGHGGGLPHAEEQFRINSEGNPMALGRNPKKGIRLDALQIEAMIEEYRNGTINEGPQTTVKENEE